MDPSPPERRTAKLLERDRREIETANTTHRMSVVSSASASERRICVNLGVRSYA
jgi:hypothetical protein